MADQASTSDSRPVRSLVEALEAVLAIWPEECSLCQLRTSIQDILGSVRFAAPEMMVFWAREVANLMGAEFPNPDAADIPEWAKQAAEILRTCRPAPEGMMAKEWQRGTFFIILRGDEGQRLAEVTGVTRGHFGVHPDPGRVTYRYIVTHLPTGYWLACFQTEAAAKTFCGLIEPLTDWSKVSPENWPEYRPKLDQQLKAAMRATGGRQSEPQRVEDDDDIPF